MGRDQNRFTVRRMNSRIYAKRSDTMMGDSNDLFRRIDRWTSSSTPARSSSRESSDARVVPIGRRLCGFSAPLSGYRVERPKKLEGSAVRSGGLILRQGIICLRDSVIRSSGKDVSPLGGCAEFSSRSTAKRSDRWCRRRGSHGRRSGSPHRRGI